MRQEEFNKKMNRFFDKHGLLDLDRVKLDGIKPRMASQETTAGRDSTMEVRDPWCHQAHHWVPRSLYICWRFPFEGSVLRNSELSEGDFERIWEVHEQNIFPNSKRVAPPRIKGFSTRISTKRVNLAHPNEGSGTESARTFLVSKNQSEFLDLNSNAGGFDDTRKADINTEGFLVISRDPPECGKDTRSGAASLAKREEPENDWSVSGDDWASAKSQRQPKSEFGSYKPHAEFEFGKHDVALFLEECVLPEKEEE
jgi:hypothetical protein